MVVMVIPPVTEQTLAVHVAQRQQLSLTRNPNGLTRVPSPLARKVIDLDSAAATTTYRRVGYSGRSNEGSGRAPT